MKVQAASLLSAVPSLSLTLLWPDFSATTALTLTITPHNRLEEPKKDCEEPENEGRSTESGPVVIFCRGKPRIGA